MRVTPPGVRIPLSPQKETHNVSCGFFVFKNKRNLFQFVLKNKKQTTHSVVVVSMFAKDIFLGS
nr:hypothetical protein [uncultured bacterium]